MEDHVDREAQLGTRVLINDGWYKSRILPIWHKITKDDVLKHTPSLIGKMALTTATLSVDDIVASLKRIVDS